MIIIIINFEKQNKKQTKKKQTNKQNDDVDDRESVSQWEKRKTRFKFKKKKIRL